MHGDIDLAIKLFDMHPFDTPMHFLRQVLGNHSRKCPSYIQLAAFHYKKLVFVNEFLLDSATSKSYCHDGEWHPILCHDTFTGGLILYNPLIHSVYP